MENNAQDQVVKHVENDHGDQSPEFDYNTLLDFDLSTSQFPDSFRDLLGASEQEENSIDPFEVFRSPVAQTSIADTASVDPINTQESLAASNGPPLQNIIREVVPVSSSSLEVPPYRRPGVSFRDVVRRDENNPFNFYAPPVTAEPLPQQQQPRSSIVYPTITIPRRPDFVSPLQIGMQQPIPTTNIIEPNTRNLADTMMPSFRGLNPTGLTMHNLPQSISYGTVNNNFWAQGLPSFNQSVNQSFNRSVNRLPLQMSNVNTNDFGALYLSNVNAQVMLGGALGSGIPSTVIQNLANDGTFEDSSPYDLAPLPPQLGTLFPNFEMDQPLAIDNKLDTQLYGSLPFEESSSSIFRSSQQFPVAQTNQRSGKAPAAPLTNGSVQRPRTNLAPENYLLTSTMNCIFGNGDESGIPTSVDSSGHPKAKWPKLDHKSRKIGEVSSSRSTSTRIRGSCYDNMEIYGQRTSQPRLFSQNLLGMSNTTQRGLRVGTPEQQTNPLSGTLIQNTNVFLPSPRPVPNTVYDPAYAQLNLPVDPHLRRFDESKDNGGPNGDASFSSR